ncbi:MAG: hypothetical protein ABIG28_02210 [archaeon]
MKKRKHSLKIIFILFFIIFLNLPLINGQTAPLGDLEKTTESLEKYRDIATDNVSRNEYLKQEWAKILNKSYVSPYIEKSQTAIKFLDPVFEIFIGTTFKFSWSFLLTFIIWLLLISVAFDFLIIVEYYFKPEKYSKHARWSAWIIFVGLISTIRIPLYFSDFIVKTISLTNHWGIQVILLVIIIVLLVFLSKYTKMINKHFSKARTSKTIKSNKKKIEEQKDNEDKLRESLQKGAYNKKSMREEAAEQSREELEGISKEDD